MKLKLLFFCSVAVGIITFTGCPYESKVSLSDAKDSAIDPEIIGKWLLKSGSGQRYDTLIIMRFNEHEYYFESHELKDSKPFIDRGRGFITRIGNEKILNFCGLKDPGKFFFARYVVSGERMITNCASDQYIKEKFNSDRELYDFFKIHIGRQGFFEQGDTLTMINDE